MNGPFRLACRACDRDDFDGIDRLPDNWTDIVEAQSLEDSITEVAPGDRKGDLFAWYTHIGLCPDCRVIDGD